MYSCENGNVTHGRELYEMYFKKVLKDPESFTVYKEEYRIEESIKVEWVIDYGAKNGFGGMERETVEFTTIGDALYINNSMYERRGNKLIMAY